MQIASLILAALLVGWLPYMNMSPPWFKLTLGGP